MIFLLISCNEDPVDKDPYDSLILLDGDSAVYNGLEVYLDKTILISFLAGNHKDINCTDIEWYRYRVDDNPDKSWERQIFFETFYDIKSGDTLNISIAVPDTLSATPGNDEKGYVRDRIRTQTRYKGGADQSVNFNLLILEE